MNPFIGLITTRARRLPVTGQATRVVCGQTVRSDMTRHQIDEPQESEDAELDDEAQRLRRARELAYYRDYYQRHKNTPEFQAKRKAERERDRDAARKRSRAWAEKNRDRLNANQAAWRRERYHSDPEVRERQKAAQRTYYARNREAILAKKRARRQAAKGEAAAPQGSITTTTAP